MPTLDFHALLDTNSPGVPRSPTPLNGRELESLLRPVSCEEFVSDYFSRVSLNVVGHPKKFENIFGWERLREALARGKSITDKRYNIMAAYTSGGDTGSPEDHFDVHDQEVSELLQAGATVCISNIHMADPSLAQLAQAIRAQLNFSGTVGVHCYVSPDNSGLPMHFDRRVSTTLQISGRKRWRFSTRAAQVWPLENFVCQPGKTEVAGADGRISPASMEMREVELGPGDLLCLPAGAFHSACGVGHSLALNIYFAPRNFLEQLSPMLEAFAAKSEHWRGGPPATAVKIDGSLPVPVKAYMRERLDEFHKMVLELIDGPEALTESWLNSLMRDPYTGWQPFLNKPLPGATPGQKFRVAISSLHFVETRDKVIVPCDYGAIRLPANSMPVLRQLSSRAGSFTIPQLLSWCHQPEYPLPEEILSMMKALYQGGILRVAG
jgi:ribosomal protein L16 Arg81 hydroxylase